MTQSWTAELWSRAEPIFAAILDHPFLRGLADGSLDTAAFIADRVGPSLGPDEAGRAAAHFETTSRYEWMFWDAAWRLEAWPP